MKKLLEVLGTDLKIIASALYSTVKNLTSRLLTGLIAVLSAIYSATKRLLKLLVISVTVSAALASALLGYRYLSSVEISTIDKAPKTVAPPVKKLISNLKTTDKLKAEASVKIVRDDKKSGGSGTIIASSIRESYVLTNSHVCEVVANGGLVIKDDGSEHRVMQYRQSMNHDLCMIKVLDNLGVNTAIATNAPELYSEATVSGHPALLPDIITKGHFSGRVSTQVGTGVEPCTEEEANGPNGLLCLMYNGLPRIKTYQTQIVSPTIMPGSSGSGVYDVNGAIAGVVFAGRGELGYGVIVPFEYVLNFLESELNTLVAKVPNEVEVYGRAPASERIERDCTKFKDENRKRLCDMLKSTGQ